MTYVTEEFYEQTTTTTYPSSSVGALPTPSADFGGDYGGYGYGAASSPSGRFSPTRRPSSPTSLRPASPTGSFRPLRTPPPIPAGYSTASPSYRPQPQPQMSPYRPAATASPSLAGSYHSPSFRSRSPVNDAGAVAGLYGSVYGGAPAAPAPLGAADNEDYEYVYFRETRDQQPSYSAGRSPSFGLSGYAPPPPAPPVDYDYLAPQPSRFASAYATASPRYETSVSRFYGDEFAAPVRPSSPSAFDTRVSYSSPSFHRPSSPVASSSFAPAAPAPLSTYSPSYARPSSPIGSFVRPSSPSFVSAATLGGGQVVEEFEEYYSREEY